MSRTVLILGGAAVLAVVALALGLPRLNGASSPGLAPPPVLVSDGSLGLSARLSHPLLVPGAQDVFAAIEVRAVQVPGRARGPVNLALVLDRSGSMAGFKLQQAKLAARALVERLGEQDRLALVHYGSDVKVSEGLLATPENKARLLAAIEAIWDDGGTNIGGALAAAGEALRPGQAGASVSRLLLVSDGQPTEGVTDTPGLQAVVRELKAQGLSVSCLGVGEDFNEQLMASLAEVGAGAYGYLQDPTRLAEVFQKDLDAAGAQVARAVSLTFRLPAGTRLVRVLGHGEVARQADRQGELVTVALPDFAAGQVERLVAQLEVVGGAEGQAVEVTQLTLGYLDLLAGTGKQSAARLAAATSADPAQVGARRDPQAVVFAARARAAANAEAAAQRVGEGDLAGARQLLQANQVLFDQAAALAGPAALAEDVAGNRATLREAEGARSDSEVRQYQKAVNQRARRAYGLTGSTY